MDHIVMQQHGDKENQMASHLLKKQSSPLTARRCCYQFSNKIVIIVVVLSFVYLSIWNFLHIKQMNFEIRMHKEKLQQLKFEINALFEMVQNDASRLLGIPITSDMKQYLQQFSFNKNDNDVILSLPNEEKRIIKNNKEQPNKYNSIETRRLKRNVNQEEKRNGHSVLLNSMGTFQDHKVILKLERIKRSYKAIADRDTDEMENKIKTPHGHNNSNKHDLISTIKKGKDSIVNSYNKPAIHFHLNRRVTDTHSDIRVHPYDGDLYIGHPSWTNEINTENDFHVTNGVLRVHQPGLYYVYAQVCYNNTYDHNGYIIFHGNKPFLQCLNTVPTNLSTKIHTCHTSGLIYLKSDEKLHIRDFHRDRNAVLKDSNYRSYFGLIKV